MNAPPIRRVAYAVAVLGIAAAATACGGGPGTPDGSTVNSPGGPVPPPTQMVGVRVSVTLPAAGKARAVRPNYVSPNTHSLTVALASVDGSPVTGAGAATIDTVPASPHCRMQDARMTCAGNVSGAAGDDVFTVATYDGVNATGAVLSAGTVSARIGAGGGGLPIDDALSLSIDGVIAKLELHLLPRLAPRGKPTSAAVSLVAFDSSNAQIVGASRFASPIALSIQGDTQRAFTLRTKGASGPSLSIARPTADIALTYDGSRQASPVTIAASVSAPNKAGANAPFGLRGSPPPPPAGTTYVLNLGSGGDGRAATVTVYDGGADGNAAPIRTLHLSAKSYARGLTVDSLGRLYVGYLDSDLGFSPATGEPDGGNFVAIYAAGAAGIDPPAATLTSDKKTHSALYPLYLSFDPEGDLVTYGATAIDGNTGDAVLTYGPGSSGPAAPAHGWNFASPTIGYAGPTGLALDAAGNFYLSGSLKTALGPDFGIFVASAGDLGNPSADPARTIPWDTTTELTPGLTTNVALDSSGEVFVANTLFAGSGSGGSCQARANVFAAGAGGGTTDVPPLRVIVLGGVATANPQCASPRNPLVPFFPAIAIYGPTLFVADDFNNAVSAFAANAGGSAKALTRIAGPATLLDAPIALAISSLSGQAAARPVTGRAVRAPALVHQAHIIHHLRAQ